MCAVLESKERGWTELGEEKGRPSGVLSGGAWTREVTMEVQPRGNIRAGEVTWEISQAVSKH